MADPGASVSGLNWKKIRSSPFIAKLERIWRLWLVPDVVISMDGDLKLLKITGLGENGGNHAILIFPRLVPERALVVLSASRRNDSLPLHSLCPSIGPFT